LRVVKEGIEAALLMAVGIARFSPICGFAELE
jgi:hypothetical protein